MKISIIGTGYVGLVTGTCLAEVGHNVTCVDIVKEKVNIINNGKTPVYEPGLEELITKNIAANRMRATTESRKAIVESDVTFICVGTPPKENGDSDLSFVRKTSEDIGKALAEKSEYHVIVVKSTVPPGTSRSLISIIEKQSKKKARKDFGVCMNPEFLREGCAVKDFMEPDRIVIGELDNKAGDLVSKIYYSFNAPILRSNLETAEMIKYTSNSLLSTLISFSNEIGNICELVENVDVNTVLQAVHLDKRLSPIVGGKSNKPPITSYLKAGCGFGGSCFPKDVTAIIAFAKNKGYSPQLLCSVLQINRERPKRMLALLKRKLGELENKKIAILGLAFKPDTDDMRESPAVPLINLLLQEKATLVTYDPQAVENAKKIWGTTIIYASSPEDAIRGADACVLITSWKEFHEIKPKTFKKLLKTPILIDGRRIYNPQEYSSMLNYVGVGYTQKKNRR